jgi:hypothetical protein
MLELSPARDMRSAQSLARLAQPRGGLIIPHLLTMAPLVDCGTGCQ